MSLETGTYISDLVSTNPTATDPKSAGDDHIRLLKATVKATFPNVSGAVTATHTELNIIDGVTASTAELNIMDGVTASTAEINILDGVTSSTAEINILTGLTASTAELNKLDGVTATTAEINKLAGATSSTTELNYVTGVTSAIQTQFTNMDAAKADISGETYTGTHNFTGATVTVPTKTYGTAGNYAASVDYVSQASFQATLPAMTGNDHKVLYTDAGEASWQYPDQQPLMALGII